MIAASDVALIVGLILSLMGIISYILIFKDRAVKPHKENEERITALEEEVDDIKDILNHDKGRIESLEEGNRILIKSMSALLSHGIDGNNTEEMKKARKDLQDYLVSK